MELLRVGRGGCPIRSALSWYQGRYIKAARLGFAGFLARSVVLQHPLAIAGGVLGCGCRPSDVGGEAGEELDPEFVADGQDDGGPLTVVQRAGSKQPPRDCQQAQPA